MEQRQAVRFDLHTLYPLREIVNGMMETFAKGLTGPHAMGYAGEHPYYQGLYDVREMLTHIIEEEERAEDEYFALMARGAYGLEEETANKAS